MFLSLFTVFAVAGAVGDMVLSWCSGWLGLTESLSESFLKVVVASVQKICILQLNESYCSTTLLCFYEFHFIFI